ncbi:MAG TPA: lysylphosphatidylglycerol synthase transmembrane domain-containing protein [Verrucomicrobiae bacterium]|nr:lysylphosphatidylglycerol synthase transmembrane domain-containing protein [Verrucomicrobiae bacterium]
MDKKRILASAVVFLILAVLVYLQYRHWRTFDWGTFWSTTHRVNKLRILYAVGLIYFAYWVRALRWKVFLQPVRPKTKVRELVSPTVIGFTGLALLGRAGEFIRPYLIARRTDLSFSSQLAVWAVERIFDFGAFALLLAVSVFREGGMLSIPDPGPFYRALRGGVLLLNLLVAAVAIGAVAINRWGDKIAAWIEHSFSHLPRNLGQRAAAEVRKFGTGLNTIHGPVGMLWAAVTSVGMWYLIALSYKAVTHSYGAAALDIPLIQVLILMGASMAGSILQLPGVGGGSQLAVIAVLSGPFAAPTEMAVSCGILLWLVTFAAVVPLGLLLAHHERLSLRKLSKESHQAEETAIEMVPPGSA